MLHDFFILLRKKNAALNPSPTRSSAASPQHASSSHPSLRGRNIKLACPRPGEIGSRESCVINLDSCLVAVLPEGAPGRLMNMGKGSGVGKSGLRCDEYLAEAPTPSRSKDAVSSDSKDANGTDFSAVLSRTGLEVLICYVSGCPVLTYVWSSRFI